MNDEQVVLDFFSKEENLPLALTAGDHIDSIRLEHNNAFWLALQQRLADELEKQSLPWDSEITEDRNSENCLVGVHLQPQTAQSVFLRPFMEQQFMGSSYRIYYGLMWNTAPDAAKLNLAEVTALRDAFQQDSFKTSDSFLAWMWTPWHPRKQDFLLRFTQERDALLDDAVGLFTHLLMAHNEALAAGNAALAVEAPRSISIPLDQLRASLKK